MRNATPQKHGATMEPLDEAVDHVRGPSAGRLIVEYGDYECPYSRQAFREIERVELQLSDMPPSSSSMWRGSTAIGPAVAYSHGFAATWRAG
jgi:hypothetical protein